MLPALLDTSVYVSALRRGNVAIVGLRMLGAGPVWISSVVLEELYAGAGASERRVVEKLQRDFEAVKRIVVPNLGDWSRAGRVLASLAAKYGFEQIGRGRLTNDALIAVSAGRCGLRVFTANERDYRRLSEFCTFDWQVVNL